MLSERLLREAPARTAVTEKIGDPRSTRDYQVEPLRRRAAPRNGGGNGQAAREQLPGQEPRTGCRGCGNGAHAHPPVETAQRARPAGNGDTTQAQAGNWPAAYAAYWDEIQRRLGMLHWMEQGLVKLRDEAGRNGKAWTPIVLQSAVEGMLEAVEETMLQCDELRTYTSWGSGNGREAGAVCGLTQLYENLEQRLRLHLGMEGELKREDGREVTR
jgi:hypothetical protein